MGIRFELNCSKERYFSGDAAGGYDAVFVGVRTYRSMKADLPNEDAPGVYDAFTIPHRQYQTGDGASGVA